MNDDVVLSTDPSDVFRVRLRELMHLPKDLLETGRRRDFENGQWLVSRVRNAMGDSLWDMNGDAWLCLNLVIRNRYSATSGNDEEHLLRLFVVVHWHHGPGVECLREHAEAGRA